MWVWAKIAWLVARDPLAHAAPMFILFNFGTECAVKSKTLEVVPSTTAACRRHRRPPLPFPPCRQPPATVRSGRHGLPPTTISHRRCPPLPSPNARQRSVAATKAYWSFHLLIWGRFGKGSDSNRLIQWARKGLIFHVEPGGRSILLRLCCYFNKGIS
uniref:Secreted protein n=1 Tax=Oryza meridionalis TaxID=40149 RepID=A0A0E0C0X6_9ORYZ